MSDPKSRSTSKIKSLTEHAGRVQEIEYADGIKEWYKNGQLHREDGPAIIYTDGSGDWWMYGRKLSDAQVDAIKHKIELEKKLTNKTELPKKSKI